MATGDPIGYKYYTRMNLNFHSFRELSGKLESIPKGDLNSIGSKFEIISFRFVLGLAAKERKLPADPLGLENPSRILKESLQLQLQLNQI